jgi:hypothetical protein
MATGFTDASAFPSAFEVGWKDVTPGTISEGHERVEPKREAEASRRKAMHS